MEKHSLKKQLQEFLDNFNAEEINTYFARDFSSEWDIFLSNNQKVEPILEYLNDTFIDIDIDYRETEEFDTKVRETIQKAIEMLNSTK